jgi:crossover junction endodeoxyribonuclease RuvC
MKIRIIGIDPSLTGTGIVVLENDKIIYKQILTSKLKDIARLYDLRDKLKKIIFKFLQVNIFVVLEGYSFGSRIGQSFSIGEWCGLIKMFLYENNIPFIVVQPTILKKFVTGKGNVHKDLILMNIYKKFKVDFTRFKGNANNIGDAFSLAIIGWYLYCFKYKKRIKMSQIQKEIIRNLNNSKFIENEYNN